MFFLIMFLIGVILVIAYIGYQSNDSYYTSSNSSSRSTSQVYSANYSVDLPDLSPELMLDYKKNVNLFAEGFLLYKANKLKPASTKFREAANILETICSKYPNNLHLNFGLLEAYQGCDWGQAIQKGFKCREIVHNLIQESANEQDYEMLNFLRYRYIDIVRKLYKILIKENKKEEAKLILAELIKLLKDTIENAINGPLHLYSDDEIQKMKTLIYSLSREMMIAQFFLEGIIEGRNVRRNLMVSPMTVDCDPELGYHFNASFGSADSKLLMKLNA